MAGEILFLAHRTPFPPDRGDKIRSHNVLKALAALAPVHVGCLGETDADMAEEKALAALAASYCMPRRTKPLPLAGIEALATGAAISISAFENKALYRWVRDTLTNRPIAAIYIFSGQMGQYVPHDWSGRLVVDFVDVDSAKFEAYAAKSGLPMRWVHAREGRLLRHYEAQLAARADCSLLVSDEEAALMRARCPGVPNIGALRNGIDCALYDPAKVRPHRDLANAAGPHFVFSGQMDYAPNIDAVERFTRRIMPAILTLHPAAQFHIVGRVPTPAVRKLASEQGVTVWGEVPDVRPFLAAASMVVAPLTIARGVQNKVLEAMAMAKTVLASPEALTGIDGEDGEHFLRCDSDAEFVAQACALADDRFRAEKVGKAARQLVLDRMSWPAMMAPLADIVGLTPGPERTARRNAA
ncbi:TIGR03087 family PEP-CTERM/XrtA system glycosyltransferase [Aurantiacibacter xanthus]|uniref:TIGR03087 family PEP-CTERM/XrtA system glycosyltransferase n=1 Tax=Aurantiacibacter xanthus TaxID=1784712 RepID=A0A3A1PD27_9SPHN|nr:TIGR03087 family PEP-CTERM/XrtA system glycosyltransferase [Aurantiacibacter xanthus]RIV90893.1 TIGR03087 family PEP-CTERM/XrtA system glycosyltransferase [Aurantiacibacter xanthus]